MCDLDISIRAEHQQIIIVIEKSLQTLWDSQGHELRIKVSGVSSVKQKKN